MAGFPPHADLRLHASKVREPIVLNGSATPVPVVMRADVPNRLRLINITASNSRIDGDPSQPFRPDVMETRSKGRPDAATTADGRATSAPACVGW
jgi:hypothetical protein